MFSLKEFEVHARRAMCHRAFELFFWQRFQDGRVSLLRNMEFEVMEPSLEREGDGIYIPEEMAQQLVDELWLCGIRPSEGTGSAGSLKATQNHLADMQKLSWKLLEMVEGKQIKEPIKVNVNLIDARDKDLSV